MSLEYTVILGLAFSLGLLCLLSPMVIARAVAWWTRSALGDAISKPNINPRLAKALNLIDKEPGRYQEEFQDQLRAINRTGIVAVLIALLGACMLLIAR